MNYNQSQLRAITRRNRLRTIAAKLELLFWSSLVVAGITAWLSLDNWGPLVFFGAN